VENLTGTAAPGPAQARDLRARYTVLVPIGDLDQIVIASSHLTLKKTGCWWPSARYLVRSGPDGADLALLDVIGREHASERFSRITIASGDGGFAQAAAELTNAGCHVTVLTRRARLSRRLALAADGKILYVDPPGSSTPVTAPRPSQAA
jgi:hypothetical protein